MITDYDKKLLTEAGRDYIFDIVLESKYLKENISFKEHVLLCNQVNNLTYEEVISLTITEDIRAFEGKFSKFLKYSIAAIAGMPLGPTGPPTAMFILYLYRKLTDTCERSCFRKFPLSKQRKICKYECQLNAARKMANDIRSEIAKCSQFTRVVSCEKKLQKEYIKWAKRVQLLIVKLNRAKLDLAEKQRKANAKELSRNARALAAGLDLSGMKLSDFIAENKQLRDRLPFEKHLELYNAVASNESENIDGPAPFKVDPKKEKQLRQAMYLGLWIVPIPFFNDLVNYLVKKYSAGCAGKCGAQMKIPKDVCYSQCAYLGAKYAVQELNKQMSKCNKADTPEKVYKCKKTVLKLKEDWKQREVERKIKFEALLRRKIQDAREKKQRQKEKAERKAEKASKVSFFKRRAHY